MKRVNLFDAEFEYDDADPEPYKAGVARVGQAAGGEALAIKLYEIPPGQSLCPYHYEYEEEWLIVLQGTVIVRVPDGEHESGAGDTICFPPGPAGAHKVTNNAQAAARVLMFSSAHLPAVAVYPDSDKLGVWTQNKDDHALIHRADCNVDYYDGEV